MTNKQANKWIILCLWSLFQPTHTMECIMRLEGECVTIKFTLITVICTVHASWALLSRNLDYKPARYPGSSAQPAFWAQLAMSGYIEVCQPWPARVAWNSELFHVFKFKQIVTSLCCPVCLLRIANLLNSMLMPVEVWREGYLLPTWAWK